MLSNLEIEEFKKLSVGNDLLEKVYKELMSIYEDPTKAVYKEITQAAVALSKEMSHVRNGEEHLAPILKSDDKTFERMFKIITEAEKVFAGIRKGKEDVFPEEAKSDKEKEKEEGLSFADKMANKKRKD